MLESVKVLEPEHDLIEVRFNFQGGVSCGMYVPRGTTVDVVSKLVHEFADVLWSPPKEAEAKPVPEVPVEVPSPSGEPEGAPPDTGGTPEPGSTEPAPELDPTVGEANT
jgi:hypothetical protein